MRRGGWESEGEHLRIRGSGSLVKVHRLSVLFLPLLDCSWHLLRQSGGNLELPLNDR